jgi:CRP-like cAMP-binding protein
MPDVDLSKLEFFRGFSADELRKVRDMAEEVEAEAGAILMEQGDVGQEMFVITSGQASVIVNGHRVASVGPGTALGEMALLELRPRSATVEAVTDLELLSFDNKRFHKLLEDMPGAAERIAEHTRELREQNEQL